MQNIDKSGEDELIRLLLKRQSELNSLLEVTRAINKNIATPVLVQMLEVILQSYLQVGKFRFLIEDDENFICIAKYGGTIEPVSVLHRICTDLSKFKVATPVANHSDPILKTYDYFIPIYHKTKALAYAFIGDFNSSPEMLNNDLNFIQTLINVVLVALENKRLFRERLQTERFEREMELAVEVQNMLVPIRIHKDDGVEIDARYLPHQNIGGDYFDFIRLNEDEFIWCIADVSGKGISAALLMANFQASLHAWATVESDLTNIIERLNKIVLNNTKGERFITLFLAKYNQKTRLLNYINAGHNPAILFSNGEAIPLKLGTTMIGAFEELPFLNQGEIDIDPGSLIFNYTDGLMDYESQGPKSWNEEKLRKFVLQHGNDSPDSFNQTLLDHVAHLTKGKAIDDITLLTLRIF
ncbi:PP2C family protein-serine/threonine phosphatase [Mucilaginibacter sp. E4BP6]|jgi:sigma-B regulation protein RsbU (phosphoserine phosphatase)|uniref:PP2C family protein-serine/threonine phosphatase n=1 Tax=Mucilaginibacter sp. E4BP6 TaxID=2723089 RepID=UPI0015C7B436|nr:PP2C family protein-serine/threonine phosphatase [Mucilaginibacter sp. E4BP6]NYE66668.1 sigma-B regulation protein RsbU (phosphoserine phosphatase) [Mucilaginibacter sp. E4BP6]